MARDMEKKRLSNLAWYEKNREKILAVREANREELRKKYRDFYWANRERMSEKNRAYRESNRERLAEFDRAKYRASRQYIIRREVARVSNLDAQLPIARSKSRWTESEDAIVVRDLAAVELAYMLQRSIRAIRARRHVLKRRATKEASA